MTRRHVTRMLPRVSALLVAGLMMLTFVLVVLGASAGPARADGDPGSDELLAQNLFFQSARLSVADQLSLGHLLDQTAAAGAPVRVALIAAPADLGFYTSLFDEPERYASRVLGVELSGTYAGRLLVVTPTGYGVYWGGHPAGQAAALRALARVPVAGTSAAGQVAAIRAATLAVERATGVAPSRVLSAHVSGGAATAAGTGATVGTGVTVGTGSPPAGVSTSGGTARATSRGGSSWPGWLVAVVLVAALSAPFWVPPLWRRRPRPASGRPLSESGRPRTAPGRPRTAFAPGTSARQVLGSVHLPAGRRLAFVALPVAALVVLAVAVHGSGSGPAPQLIGDLSNNPNLAAGTPLVTRPVAHDFSLTDETGRTVTLRQYRGKVVILSFVDAECQTICPLTTTAMLDAKRDLGPAGRDVQLLGVDANWLSRQIYDVENYTQLHGLLGQWHFLTGSLAQLGRVWSAYGLNEYALLEREQQRAAARHEPIPSDNVIDHTPATFIIGPTGHTEQVFETQNSYAAIPQLGQLMAQEASRLLPSHPRVDTHYAYGERTGTAPTTTVTLPRSGGGTVTLGPGTPHLYVFFATWDVQTTPLASDLDELNEYARYARRHGLPSPVAVDEGSVEPNVSALPAFLSTLKHRLDFPVAIDDSGRVADGYGVDGDPWLVATNDAGQNVWNDEVYTEGWPTLGALTDSVSAALSPGGGGPLPRASIRRQLAGSPPVLAALHDQAAQALPGGISAVFARLRALRGHPVVLNIWYSTCAPCVKEAPLLAHAAARFGRRVAFLGVDWNDSAGALAEFMREHEQSYPSYLLGSVEPADSLLPGAVQVTPTTIFYDASGQRTNIKLGSYDDQGSLDGDIEQYATGG